jgi:predicted O-methyltransferase YrrM
MTKMITNPETYFGRLIPDRDELLLKLEAEAREENIPIVGPVVGEMLFVLARATQAKKILELGTATGYSTLFLARACDPLQGRVTTLERDADLAERARDNFVRAGLTNRIEIRQGDAIGILHELQDPFDLIFLDIDKQEYHSALAHSSRLLRPGGLLVADNTGFSDAHDFNQTIHDDPAWRYVQLFAFLPLHSPEKDGICIALRT